MDETKTLLLRETGVARLANGKEGVNVGPIVAALAFLTEGRGEDRGIDEQGAPLPDLLSLAYDVIQAIILGGRQADYLRQVKRSFDAEFGLEGHASLALAKHAKAVRHATPSSALEHAAEELRQRLAKLDELTFDDVDRTELDEAIAGFRGFGADRWVTATSHLLIALRALPRPPRVEPAPPPKRRHAKPPAKAETKPKTKPKPLKAAAKARIKAKTQPKTKTKAKTKPARRRA